MTSKPVSSGLLLLAAAFFTSGVASGQYCGGTLEYAVRDQRNLLIEASAVEVIKNTLDADSGYIKNPSRANRKSFEQKQRERELNGKSDAPSLSKEDLESEKSYRKPGNIEGLHLSTFAIRMGCGKPLVELWLRYKGDLMKLRFVNVIEMDAVLDSIPFDSGTFEIDFREIYNTFPRDKSKFNSEGLRSGDDVFLPWHARGGVLISSSNWKKIDEN